MKPKILGLLIFLSLLFAVSADEVRCEEIKMYDWSYTGDRLTCYLNSSGISWSGVTVAPSNEPVAALWLEQNERVKCLPVEVAKTFPHLFGYNANSCSIKSISKYNFIDLKELEVLSLEHNQIEMINRDTFEDLVSLQVLHLGHNKIKTMTGAVFRWLTKAHYISLFKNECVDESFPSPKDIEGMFEIVNKNCGFYDSEDVFNLSRTLKFFSAKHFQKIHKVQAGQNEKFESFVEKTIKEKDMLQLKNAELQVQISRLEVQLRAAIEAKDQFQSQVFVMKEVYDKLEARLNSTCSGRL